MLTCERIPVIGAEVLLHCLPGLPVQLLRLFKTIEGMQDLGQIVLTYERIPVIGAGGSSQNVCGLLPESKGMMIVASLIILFGMFSKYGRVRVVIFIGQGPHEVFRRGRRVLVVFADQDLIFQISQLAIFRMQGAGYGDKALRLRERHGRSPMLFILFSRELPAGQTTADFGNQGGFQVQPFHKIIIGIFLFAFSNLLVGLVKRHPG